VDWIEILAYVWAFCMSIILNTMWVREA